MKLQKTNRDQYVLTIPKQIVRAKGWSQGEELSIKIDEKGRLIIY